ncbi:MAG: YidC/Oxa1 family membrane protein insertase [Pseudoalteromonas rhizosphaerae]|jgi:YidC/Oxa1 family membrane protein insertase|uniref:Membrane protein insertase YidC n=1 Tax=Pseudoalteromonas neustonica TaxID=1840331 RepID=A0ABY3F9I4_9GAMM|nr:MULTISPECIES: membrane protein insertase YidC [Pseudoalteromonas]MBB1295038.1 membrane protein insertase YidC [Pseudoalteromonas sp. SR41-4]MBB1302379.1 membrane protein insertase YidC [Pseudoalteromonas sp. SR44-8]MBB1310676.1 membrane protein insertase YidC [Pseudoalteromonas sp. SR41-8]MBB1398733.1 membrane protein insertase YidC [Pseudoalteromonas sp. SG44-8]MBB1410474.1 membrane protein insertase YidC [Pseudoalteromonas sp. SG44-17]|tara:strand:- start:1522 stop:3156 length:1635 start_codon:yes stop_codon:yes gene_type:complete
MESQRTFLFIGLMLVSFLLFQEWNKDYNAPKVDPSANTQTLQTNSPDSDDYVPSSTDGELPTAATTAKRSVIEITTDVFKVKIDTRGGDIVEADLLQYEETKGSETPYMLLGEFDGKQYFSQSGLIGLNGPDASAEGRPVYHSEQKTFALTGDELRVPLTFTDSKGVSFTKTYVFKKGQYDVALEYSVNNTTAEPIQVQLYTQVKRTVQDKGSLVDQNYLGAAYGSAEEKYEKYSFSDMADKNLSINTQGGYIAFIQHYFVSAWVPSQEQQNTLYSLIAKGNAAIIGAKGEPINVQANQQATLGATYYMGPKESDILEAIHPNLDLTVDYGWLWFISQPLFILLKWLHSILGNWGVAIIAITVIVKSAMYPLTKAQYTSMAKMRALQPKMAALKEKFGDDRQKFGQATMEMYRKEKVNPMGGCFPILLQMPIFLALFYVFLESTELRHAEFIFWLTDLSAKDPYYVLPILFGASMFITQKLQPMTVTDPMQQKMMTFMPVIFSVFFLWFPSGLVLYWLVSNLISIAQMLIIYRGMEKQGIKVRG